MFNGFQVLDLPLVYPLDLNVLEQAYKRKIEQTHPDRKTSNYASSAADVNQAYTLLKDPVQRAYHLLSLLGREDYKESSTVPEALLSTSFEHREALSEANDLKTCQKLFDQAQKDFSQKIIQVEQAFDQQDLKNLSFFLLNSKYLQKFLQEIQNKIWQLEDTM